MARLRKLFVVGLSCTALLGWHGAAFAQQETLDRIEAVYSLSERNNTAALKLILTLGEQLPDTTPYVVLAAEHASAFLKLDEALPLAMRSGNAKVLSQHYRILGKAQLLTGKFEPALQSYLKSLQYADQQTDHPKQSRLRSLNGLSNVYSAMKDHVKTLAVIDEALALAKELDSRKMMATLYLNQGGSYAELGRNADDPAANQRVQAQLRPGG